MSNQAPIPTNQSGKIQNTGPKPPPLPKTEDDKTEFFDTKEDLEIKITKLANLIKKSKHFIAFTGAGISTSCGIPDFRSPLNTKLDTGVGMWSKQEAINVGIKIKQTKKKNVDILQAVQN